MGGNEDLIGKTLNDLFFENGLDQLIKEPTRIQGQASSCIDLAVTNIPGLVSDLKVLDPIGMTDHSTLILRLDIFQNKDQPINKRIWKYDQTNTEGLNNELRSINWQNFFTNQPNIDEMTINFTENILRTFHRQLLLVDQ